MPDTTRLEIDRIVSVGFVASGANPESDVAFFKSDLPADAGETQVTNSGETTMKEGTMPEADATDEVAETEVVDTPEEIVEPAGEVVAEPEVEKSSDEVLKTADPVVQELVAKLQAEKSAADERLNNVEKKLDDEIEKSTTLRYVRKAEAEFGRLGTPDEIGAHLRAVDSLPEASRTWLLNLLKSHQEITDTSELFKALGTGDQAADDSAEGRARAAATELRKSKPDLTKEQAYSQVLESDSELANAVFAEDRDARMGRI